ncbi:hypothetical protein PENTCL1PPCAC_14124, partial [Pristionchus entomophagus]
DERRVEKENEAHDAMETSQLCLVNVTEGGINDAMEGDEEEESMGKKEEEGNPVEDAEMEKEMEGEKEEHDAMEAQGIEVNPAGEIEDEDLAKKKEKKKEKREKKKEKKEKKRVKEHERKNMLRRVAGALGRMHGLHRSEVDAAIASEKRLEELEKALDREKQKTQLEVEDVRDHKEKIRQLLDEREEAKAVMDNQKKKFAKAKQFYEEKIEELNGQAHTLQSRVDEVAEKMQRLKEQNEELKKAANIKTTSSVVAVTKRLNKVNADLSNELKKNKSENEEMEKELKILRPKVINLERFTETLESRLNAEKLAAAAAAEAVKKAEKGKEEATKPENGATAEKKAPVDKSMPSASSVSLHSTIRASAETAKLRAPYEEMKRRKEYLEKEHKRVSNELSNYKTKERTEKERLSSHAPPPKDDRAPRDGRY